ncbi:hypothetical protein MHM84_15790 [Halomonas sp. McH1-25]|uniref:hypothetical protein n=1 Tax=unclassified Halomonas TaxID=2609666 RepID=UPI001EF6C331|nr:MULTISPECIES: hypothetical protein [unclassified Halomonas]MCG7601238.1 hypothetical protein [Halomonas sp. McH1-25]MCP1343696.1 hypothetical protein [Halomonas sp. FL8]MCP1362114.1 hypothetical protein [Halomonas sp. BBD45]
MQALRQGVVLAILGLGLTACGTTTTERATSGAGIGAAVGAGTAAVTDTGLLTGTAIGAAVGAAGGALTEEDTVNLNELSLTD